MMHPLRQYMMLVENAGQHCYTAFRFHNGVNERSDALRLGTWYGASEDATERYRVEPSRKLRIGGATLATGTICATNPFRVASSSHQVLYDLRDDLPFGDQIEWLMDDDQLEHMAKTICRDAVTWKKILAMGAFTARTILSERIAADWLKRVGYDLLVLEYHDGTPRELFDFTGLFRPDAARPQ